ITLTTDLHHTFSQENKPFSEVMVRQYIEPQQGVADEFTEYIPCFRLPTHKDIHALIYWKASLLTYEYVLMVLDKKGHVIEHKGIAGTKAMDQTLVRSVATFKEDGTIYVVGGITDSNDETQYDASNSQTILMELLEDGEIVVLNEQKLQ
ncbi:MAG: hypothetical protein AAFV25_04480, partial [Bacteroidota bacterium]